MNWTAVAALLMGLGVGLGAFGAHALKGHLDAYAMGVFEKAVLYHFFHALGLMIVSILPRVGALSRTSASRVCALLFTGVVLFSGSLYTLALTGNTTWGAVTPFGGLAFLWAWFLLAWWLLRRSPGLPGD